MGFSWDKVKKPVLALAPMEGYTDSAFRQIVKKYAPDVICYTEFTSVKGLKYKNQQSFKKIEFSDIEKPLIVQIFGNKPEHFTEITPYLEKEGFSGIDINMGCPARKVIAAEYGSFLLRNPDLAGEIVNKVSKSTKLPVSVKMRIGFSEFDEKYFTNFCLNLETAGAKMVAIHGRTTKQGFSGKAVWDPIYKVKKVLKIPVIGNGDIDSPQSAKEKLNNLDGIMVGRATFGNPILMLEIYKKLNSGYTVKTNPPDMLKIAKEHAKLAVDLWGERRGILKMRKHLLAYLKGFPHASKFRTKIANVETLSETIQILDEINL